MKAVKDLECCNSKAFWHTVTHPVADSTGPRICLVIDQKSRWFSPLCHMDIDCATIASVLFWPDPSDIWQEGLKDAEKSVCCFPNCPASNWRTSAQFQHRNKTFTECSFVYLIHQWLNMGEAWRICHQTGNLMEIKKNTLVIVANSSLCPLPFSPYGWKRAQT